MAPNAAAVGKTYPETTYAVGREKVREYALATYESNPLHLDPGAARKAGFDDVVAPPMFCVVYSSPAVAPAIFDPEVGIDFSLMVHGAQEFLFTGHQPQSLASPSRGGLDEHGISQLFRFGCGIRAGFQGAVPPRNHRDGERGDGPAGGDLVPEQLDRGGGRTDEGDPLRLAQLGEAARGEIRNEQLAAQVDRVRRDVEMNLREIGDKVGDLAGEAVETVRKELDELWERIRGR